MGSSVVSQSSTSSPGLYRSETSSFAFLLAQKNQKLWGFFVSLFIFMSQEEELNDMMVLKVSG